MQVYIGTKVIHAIPMNRLEYNHYRDWELPEGENPTDEGYLVEYTDGGVANHPKHKGYISWSPKGVFEATYKPHNGEVSFGVALTLLKTGNCRIARRGWNGSNMFLYYVPENEYPAVTDVAKAQFGPTVPYQAYIAMKTAQGSVVPWLASQTDLLASDWYVLSWN